MAETVKHTLPARMIDFVDATFAPVIAEAGMDELGDDHELTITVGQLREFHDLAKSASLTEFAPSMLTELKMQQAWLYHWIEDVRGGLKPTLESLENRLSCVNAAVAKAEGRS